MAEDFLIAGGLHHAVDSEWSAGQPKPTAAAPAPVQVMPVTTPTPASQAPPDYKRDWMPEVPKVADEVSPYMKDEEPIY